MNVADGLKMSSAYKSRDLNPPGKVPTIELGYPAVVLFTFSPSEKESSEIPVLEGDIVQLLYSVGGWVFIQTYEGNVGYIPLDFCGQLESSKEVGSVFKKDFQKDCYPGPTHPGHEDVTDFRFRLDQTREAFPLRKKF